MCDLCEFNELVIGGIIFQHKLIHKLTWKSPDGNTESQINHILINGKWQCSLQDVRTRRHADTGSDHSLVGAVLALKLKRHADTRSDHSLVGAVLALKLRRHADTRSDHSLW